MKKIAKNKKINLLNHKFLVKLFIEAVKNLKLHKRIKIINILL